MLRRIPQIALSLSLFAGQQLGSSAAQPFSIVCGTCCLAEGSPRSNDEAMDWQQAGIG